MLEAIFREHVPCVRCLSCGGFLIAVSILHVREEAKTMDFVGCHQPPGRGTGEKGGVSFHTCVVSLGTEGVSLPQMTPEQMSCRFPGHLLISTPMGKNRVQIRPGSHRSPYINGRKMAPPTLQVWLLSPQARSKEPWEVQAS